MLHGPPFSDRGSAGGKAPSGTNTGGILLTSAGEKPETPVGEYSDYEATETEHSTNEESTTEDVTEDSWITTYSKTAECQLIAYLYNLSVGGDVGPCQNTYQYVCGRKVIDVYGGMIANVSDRVYQGFLSNNNPRGSASQKALAFYNSCMRRLREDRADLQAVTSFFSEQGLTFA